MKASTRWRIGAGLLVCAAVIGLQLIERPVPEQQAPPVEQPTALAVAPSPPVEAAAAPAAPAAVPVAAEPLPQTEQEAMARAEALLMVEPTRAMELLRAADAQFPRGALADERQFLKLRARVNLDQIAEARVDATDYLELNPNSPIAGRIHQLLGIRPPPEYPRN